MKKLFVIFLVVLVSAGLYAETKGEKLQMLNDVNPDPVVPVVTEDVGDLIWDLDVEAIAVDNQLLGIEYDGTYVWVTGGGNAADPNYLYKIDPVAGTLVNSYEQPAAASGWGIRDLAYDVVGNKIYGGNETSFFSFDIATETWTTEFSSTFGTIRALAYDGNHFWTKSFSDPIYEFGVDGTLYNTYTNANSAYGFAYDSFEDCLWLFASTTTFVQIGLDGVPTGTTHSVTLPNAGIIGGAFYYEGGLVPGKTILGCLGQGTPDVAYGMELRDAAPLASPGAPTNVMVTPDAGGALTADIDWTCPSLDVGGSTLTDLDEMRVYRDGVLIYTDTTPTIGGAGSYADAVTASGNYAYSVVGFNDAGEGIPAAMSSWVGEDVPNMVTDLLLAAVNGNGYLTWTNPTTGLNGGAFNNAILGYHIERNDGVMFEVTGLVTEYTDNTIPAADYYSYSVVPYNSVGDGGSATSNQVLIGAGNEIFFDDFETGLGNWTVELNGQPGGWLIYNHSSFPNSYTLPATSTGNIAGADADENYPIDSEMILNASLDLSGFSTANIQFDNDWQAIDADDYAYVDVSTDGGTNWTNVLMFDELDVRETHEIVDISAVAAGQADVKIRFYSVQPGWDWWWVIDNVGVYATGGGNPGSIEGNVTLDGGMGDVEDVEVTAGGNTVNPDAGGNYSISLFEGTYDVTASLAGYESMTIEDVIVTEGNATSGVDLTLTYIAAPFDPPTNLAVDANDLFTWDAPGGGGDIEELIYDNGISTGAYSYVGYSMGTQMSPSGPCQIIELKIHTSDGTEFNAEVWGWDAGAPTEDLYYQELANAVLDDWVIVDVSGENLMMDGDFVVAFGSLNAVTYMSYDAGYNNGRSWDHADAGGWSSWSEAYLVRAVVQYADGTLAELTPIESKTPATDAGEKVAIDVTPHNVDVTRDLDSYNVYLDGTMLGNTEDTFWQFTGLTTGTTYTAGVVAVYTDGESDMVTVDFIAGGSEAGNVIVAATELGNNYPNPFNPVTNIAYSIKETGNVTIEVYNMRGQLVKTLVDEVQESGDHTAIWDGTDNSNKSASSGVYFYKMVSESNIGRYTSTKKMILMK